MSTPATVIFIGPQGSGKGTQVELLAAAWQADGRIVTCIQTGDVFRALGETDSYAAQAVATCIEAGRLMPDAITNGLVVERLLKEMHAENDLIFDGYPRNQAQLAVLQEVLEFFGRQQLDVVYLNTPDQIVQARMEARGRSDDTPASIAARLQTYHQETAPLLARFTSAPNITVHDISGAATINEVHDSILNALTAI